MKRFRTVLVLLSFILLPLVAWSDSPKGEIIHAEYGRGNYFVDVTQRVISLMNGNSLNFRVDSATLGVDPAPGQTKTLRIDVRRNNGRTERLTFRENGPVIMRGYRAGYANSSGLQILRGIYGSGDRSVDVTYRLNSQIQNGQLYLPVNNNTMGGDPAPGRNKTLTVQYSYNGSANQAVVNEGDYLNLGSATGGGGQIYNQGNLQITRARYASGYRSRDVTDRLNSQIQNGQLSMRVSNETMGGDPDPGQNKTLTVQYSYNGSTNQAIVNEGDYLNLGSNSGGGGQIYNQGNLQITRARYGNGNRSSDVTDRLNSQIQNGQLSMRVSNETMGGDPDPGQNKTLTVRYALNGASNETILNEGDYLSLGSATAGGGQIYNQDNLQITRARYGNGNRSFDVTNRLNSRIQGDQLNIRVANDTMGGDPDPGRDKTLTVLYRYNGRRQSEVIVNEGDTLSLPGAVGSNDGYSGNYRIISSGTQLSIRTNETIDSKTAAIGQQYSAFMAEDVLDSSGAVAIPRDSLVTLVIRDSGGSNLDLDVESLVVSGQRYAVSTSDIVEKGREGIGANKRTGEMVGGGALLGALIGAIAGGGKGAAIGAAVGAAGGAGVQVLTRGKEVRVPAETLLNFRLDRDLRLDPVRY